MSDTIDRDELAALLDRLGSPDDAEALSAARAAHAAVGAAGLSWRDMLTSHPAGLAAANDDEDWDESPTDDAGEPDDGDPGDGDPDDDDTGDDMTDDTSRTAAAAGDIATGKGKSDADVLRLIDRMLAQEKDDAEFCEELEGYKRDIAAGEFDDRDRTYIHDLYERLRRA
jgi:hypothetical protein